jgi:hypothetical protein
VSAAWLAQKLFASCKDLCAQANRLDKILNCQTHAAVIIDDEYGSMIH